MEKTAFVTLQGCRFCLRAGPLEVLVNPAMGMTVESITFAGLALIDCDLQRAAAGATYAVPVLYPTPNRVRDGFFTFAGRKVAAQMHGAVRHAPFTVRTAQAEDEGARLTAFTDFAKGTALYDAFPYVSRLVLTLRVLPQSVTWEYTVENHGETALPYSFALHPFFKKQGETLYSVSAEKVMEADAEKLPTGRYFAAEGPKYGVNRLRTAEAAELDDVFCAAPAHLAQLAYPQHGLHVEMQASEEFRRCVVYTPAGKDWLCLEPQTSSTDCHNLYAKGFHDAANLQIVPAGTAKSGFVYLNFIKDKGENEHE